MNAENKYMVSVVEEQGDRFVAILFSVRRFTADDARNLAAWLIARAAQLEAPALDAKATVVKFLEDHGFQ